jgi:hypothetical protein
VPPSKTHAARRNRVLVPGHPLGRSRRLIDANGPWGRGGVSCPPSRTATGQAASIPVREKGFARLASARRCTGADSVQPQTAAASPSAFGRYLDATRRSRVPAGCSGADGLRGRRAGSSCRLARAEACKRSAMLRRRRPALNR